MGYLVHSLVRPLTLFTVFLCASAPVAAHASAAEEAILDETALTQLESRAQLAQPKEQCFLYAELVHNLTEIAGRQLAQGESEHVSATLKRIDALTLKIHMAL